MKWWLQTSVFHFIVVLFNAGEIKTLVASAWVEQYLLTDWEHDTVCESLPLHLAPSVLLTGSLQWISLLCVCLLSHCGGRQTRHAQRQHLHVWPGVDCTCEWGLSKIVCGNIPIPEKASFQHCVTSVTHSVEFIRDRPPACATAVIVFYMLLCRAGIHQPDQMCQHVTYDFSGGSLAPTHFALNAPIYDVMNKIQQWQLIWPEDRAAVEKCDWWTLKPVVKRV